jgi:hypothetical protein
MTEKVHDFQKQLAYSEQASYEPFWDAVYKKAFPNIINHMPCPGDSESQRMGIDRLIMLSNGLTIRIDEKKRKKYYNVDDILLEFISVDKTKSRTGTPGWIEKDLAIDYLAYAVIPQKRCYLFPWQLVRRVWVAYGDQWIATADENDRKKAEAKERGEYYKGNGFYIKSAKNVGYWTWSVIVPMKTFRESLAQSSIVTVAEELRDWTQPQEDNNES